jgi:hypothetical protein
MSLMQLVHRIGGSVMGMLLLLSAAPRPPEKPQVVLDLTSAPLSERRSMGVPGGVVRGSPGEAPVNEYDLPLILGISRLNRSSTSGTIGVELELKNAGDGPITVPSCLDGIKAFSTHDGRRRSLQIELRFQDQATGAQIGEVAEVTFGATPECIVQLETGKTIVVRFNSRIPDEPRKWQTKGPVRVRAVVQEWEIGTRQYFIERRSKAIESAFVELPLDVKDDAKLGSESVQRAFSEVSRGMYTSWSEKYLARLGDSVAPEVTQLLANRKANENDSSTAVALINMAFASPNQIKNPEDRQPKNTLTMLELLDQRVRDSAIKAKIRSTRERLQQKLPTQVQR